MPIYLIHGFKWPRASVRGFVAQYDIDDASCDYVMNHDTNRAFHETLSKLYPDVMKHLPNITFVEQHDPENLRVSVQPYAFVADCVHEGVLDVDVTKALGTGLAGPVWDAMGDLRDLLAKDAQLGWYAFWNGEPERPFNESETDGEETEETDESMTSGSTKDTGSSKVSDTED